MDYGKFLMAKLAEAMGKVQSTIEYDLQYETICGLYADFLSSEYNNANISEYDCIVAYLNALPDYALEDGDEVVINIPFLYTIGDEGYHSGKVLRSIEDCKAEVEAEIENNAFADGVWLETKI